MADVIIPLDTDVDIDFPASVVFSGSAAASYDTRAVVSFAYNNGGGGGGGGYFPISSISGSALGITVGATATILTATVGVTGGFFVGVQASGDANGNYYVSVNNTQIFRFFTNIINPEVNYTAPADLVLSHGDVIRLYVQNTGDVTSDYDGTLLGSF